MEGSFSPLLLAPAGHLSLEVGVRACFSAVSHTLVLTLESAERVVLRISSHGAEPTTVFLSPERACNSFQAILAIVAHPEARYDLRSTTAYYARVQWHGVAYGTLPPTGQAEYFASDTESRAGVEQLRAIVREGGPLAARAAELLQHPVYARAIELYELVRSMDQGKLEIA